MSSIHYYSVNRKVLSMPPGGWSSNGKKPGGGCTSWVVACDAWQMQWRFRSVERTEMYSARLSAGARSSGWQTKCRVWVSVRFRSRYCCRSPSWLATSMPTSFNGSQSKAKVDETSDLCVDFNVVEYRRRQQSSSRMELTVLFIAASEPTYDTRLEDPAIPSMLRTFQRAVSPTPTTYTSRLLIRWRASSAKSTTESRSDGVAHPSVTIIVTGLTPGRAPPSDVYTDLHSSRIASYTSMTRKKSVR